MSTCSNVSQALELYRMAIAPIAIPAAAIDDPPMAWPALAVEVDVEVAAFEVEVFVLFEEAAWNLG